MKKLKEFITWVGKQKGFEGMNSDQVITALNEMSSSEEGKAEVAKLMSAFKQDQKIGVASEVLKAQSGATLRRAQRQEYRNAMNEYRNDDEMNKYRRGYLRDMARERANAVQVPTPEASIEIPGRRFDRGEYRDIAVKHGILDKQTKTDYDGDVHERYRVANPGDKRVLIKKAKAAATEGFDESMYNFDPNQTFDRDRFRDRKRIARTINPEWNWRQRRAFALKDGEGIQSIQEPEAPRTEFTYTPNYKIEHAGPIDTNVDWNEYMDPIPEISPVKRYNQVRHTRWFNPTYGKKVSFDQFAGLLDDRMREDSSLHTGSDLRAFQAHRAKEYARYVADPENYMWRNMDDSYIGSKQFIEDEKWARQQGLLANRRGSGYYNPEDNSFASKALFRDKTAKEMLSAMGPRSTQEIYMVDETGRRLSDDEVMTLSMDPEHAYAFRGIPVEKIDERPQTSSIQANKKKIEAVPESQFSNAMNAVQAGIVATAAAPMVIQSTATAAKDIGSGLYQAGKQAIQNGRSIYGQTPQMLQQNRWYTWSQSRLPNGTFGPNVFKGGQFTTGFGNGYGQMAPHAYNLWKPGMKLSGEVISQLPHYLQTLAPFLKTGGKIEK